MKGKRRKNRSKEDKNYGKKKALTDANGVYRYPLDRIGCLYTAICYIKRVYHYLYTDVGSNRLYSDLQKSKKIAAWVRDWIKKRDKLANQKFFLF